MEHFTVFVYAKLKNNISSSINGVWAVSIPGSFSLKEGLKKAVTVTRRHIKDNFLLAPNTISQHLQFGASITNLAAEEQEEDTLVITPANLGVRKVSSIIYDSMIKSNVNWESVDDDELLDELVKRLKSRESSLYVDQIINTVMDVSSSRALVLGEQDINEFIMDAGYDPEGQGSEALLNILDHVMKRMAYHDQTLQLVAEAASERGLEKLDEYDNEDESVQSPPKTSRSH